MTGQTQVSRFIPSHYDIFAGLDVAPLRGAAPISRKQCGRWGEATTAHQAAEPKPQPTTSPLLKSLSGRNSASSHGGFRPGQEQPALKTG